LALGVWLAQLMSQTRSFLNVGGMSQEPLPILLSPTAWRYGLIGVALAIGALLLPALVASRHTIVTFRWERARALLRPLWQRYFIDLLILVPPLYGWYLLNQQGSIAFLSQGDDPFANPLLFLVPALFCFALSLLFVRLFPLVMSGVAWLMERLPALTSLITFRQLARASNQYTGPLLLISLTLSLATFTASMALTLDDHLVDQVYYQLGSDLNLAELGENTQQQEQQTLPGQQAPPPANDENGARFLFLPVDAHLDVAGVRNATRVGDYAATSNLGGRQQSGRILGIDRVDFPRSAFFRPDFANAESLGSLMNRLALGPDQLLVSRSFLTRNSLDIGDPLRLTIEAAGDFAEVPFTVAGVVDLFPTYYPDEGPLFVANLDYVHQAFGGQYPYNVWLETDGIRPKNDIVNDVRDLGIIVVTAADARETILDAQLAPERQGVFGLLTVGFLAAASLTVLGFLVYAVVSFQRRFIELGMLRAIGLSVGQMAGYLASEQAMVILVGMGLGTGIGVAASRLFIPFLQIGSGAAAQVPPFIVQIAWDQIVVIYAVFGAMFVAAVLVLIILLVRMKVFEAVKLGETI
jgi:putative ABC transport system permease protein